MADLIGPASAPNSTTTRPLLYRVFGAIDTWFKDCSTPASQDGTAYQADFFNGLLGQLRTLIRGNGNLLNGAGPVVPEVNTSDAMMLTAVQLLIARGQPNCGTDTGSADALAVGPATLWPEYVKGARVWVVKNPAAGPNATAAPSLAVSNLAPVTIVRRDGSALLPGDLPTGVTFCAEFDGAYFRLVSLTWGEVAGAVQSGKWLYGAGTGTGNAAAVTLFPAQAPVDGTEILVKWPAANAAAAPLLNLAGFGNRSVVRQGGGQIQPGDLAGYVPLIWDALNGFWRVNGFVLSDIIGFAATVAPVLLKANKTIYVDLPAGTSTGIGNDATAAGTQAAPFGTIAKALAYGQTFAAAGFGIILQLMTAGGAAYPYAAPGAAVTGVPNLQIVGSASNQAGYVLSGNLAGSTSLVNVSACNCALVGVTLMVTQASNGWASSGFGGNLVLQNVGFTDNVTSSSPVIGAGNGGTVTVGPGCTVGAAGAGVGAAALYSASANGLIYQTAYVNMLAGCAFGTTATASDGGRIIIPSNVGFTGAGVSSSSGTRYNAAYGASINVSGAGANAIPGNAAGSVSNGGVYA